MKNINIALIGAGYIAHYHARGLKEQTGVQIQSVCGLDDDKNWEFASQYCIPYPTVDVNTLFQREDIDAVVICTPNAFHAPFAISFLQNGKDVFIEKPMAINAEEGERIQTEATKNNRCLMIGHMWRFDTEVNYMRDIVQSGKIGKIVKTKGYGIHENWGPAGWFTQKSLAGGGALADMGVHAIDTIRYILGDPEPKEVYAKIGTYYGHYDVDDTGILMITWINGTTSIIESGWWHPHVDGPEASTQIFGTEGYANLFPTTLKMKIADRYGDFTTPMPTRSEHCDQVIYTRQMAHFVDSIRSRKTPCPGWKEGQAVLRIVDAAYTSAQECKSILL